MAVNKRKTKTKAQQKRAKEKFVNKVNVYNKQREKNYQNYLNIQRGHEDMLKRAMIVEALYSSRPKLSKITEDDKLVLDMDNVYLNDTDNILYWTADNNPLVAGLAPDMSSYSFYTEEFINNVLGFIHIKNKQQNNTDAEIGDFDIIELEVDNENTLTKVESNEMVENMIQEFREEVSFNEVETKSKTKKIKQ